MEKRDRVKENERLIKFHISLYTVTVSSGQWQGKKKRIIKLKLLHNSTGVAKIPLRKIIEKEKRALEVLDLITTIVL